MHQADTRTRSDGTAEMDQIPRLFNDVYTGRCALPAPYHDTWAPFPRLPSELRLLIWLTYLQRHRMVEVDIWSATDEDGTTYPGDVSQSRYYNGRNPLGKVVSGCCYTLGLEGRGSYAASLSPLLWVNNEARRTALRFYHVHLPFPRLHGKRILYLNSEYDVVYLRPQRPPHPEDQFLPYGRPRRPTILVHFLHDVKAYDNKDQGWVSIMFSLRIVCICLASVANPQ